MTEETLFYLALQKRAEERDGVLFFNPGSAGPRRFRLPITLGRLWADEQGLRGAILHLPL